jgi:hypothetical protein
VWYGATAFNFQYPFASWKSSTSWGGVSVVGWTVRGSNPGQERDFPHPSESAKGSHPSYVMRTGLGRGGNRPPPSSAEVKERAELSCSPALCLDGMFQGELYFFVIK